MLETRMSDADVPAKKSDVPAKKGEDVVLVHGKTERGDGYHVLRKRADRLELGELRNTRDGQPIHGELVKLTPRSEHERLFDVEVLAKGPAEPARAGTGPVQVATDSYRANWDAIFGPREPLN